MRDDIIERCALAARKAINTLQSDEHVARAVLTAFKEATAEPTPGMVEAADGIDDECGTAQSGGVHWTFMHEALFQEIGI